MNQYEITFIVDPVLSHDEIESTAKAYQALVTDEGCSIVNVDRLGLKQLAYPINKRSSGVFYCVEFNGDSGGVIPKMELALRRDERIMRFLTVKLDKYGIKYNEDKRAGKIGTVKKDKKEDKKDDKRGSTNAKRNIKPVAKSTKAPVPQEKTEVAAPATETVAPATEAVAPVKETAPVTEAVATAKETVTPVQEVAAKAKEIVAPAAAMVTNKSEEE